MAPFTLPIPQDPRLARALIQDPGLPHSIDDWGEIIGLSRRSLTRLFRSQTGVSFGCWRRRLRLLTAAARHADGEPIARVEASLGYESVAAFRAMARREFGSVLGSVEQQCSRGRFEAERQPMKFVSGSCESWASPTCELVPLIRGSLGRAGAPDRAETPPAKSGARQDPLVGTALGRRAAAAPRPAMGRHSQAAKAPPISRRTSVLLTAALTRCPGAALNPTDGTAILDVQAPPWDVPEDVHL
jgi:AraC-like DNA-binding protein